ncbi:MAG TPA: UDP-N-acetylglucosamine 2-epimerase (non-hydrolyzing) [Terriglobales bacterium]|nr:UDP-N-acetylglucosamine 2-epimerase (non-hydrolyzing) [Terriglobales bacterium]
MHILHVVGARPNFVKAAPVLRAIRNRGVRQTLVHTGQHYDRDMSDIFFIQLDLPHPDVNLEVGSGSHTWQTAEVMRRFEPVVLERKPDLVLVYGDVNSTIAAALVCSKLLIPVAHVEAGLRSFDTTMPEEINRVITDRLSDFLFTPSEDADANLNREGVSEGKIHRVGNVMIDSLVRLLPAAQDHKRNGLPDRYAVVTLHRAANVDNNENLEKIIDALVEASDRLEVIFPVHPRTRQRINQFGIDTRRLRLSEPLSFIEFLALESRAAFVVTDSGGIQEETTYLGVPCLTMRANTERPITVTSGTNVLVGNDKRKLIFEIENILSGKGKRGTIPLLWDGHAGDRIANILCDS